MCTKETRGISAVTCYAGSIRSNSAASSAAGVAPDAGDAANADGEAPAAAAKPGAARAASALAAAAEVVATEPAVAAKVTATSAPKTGAQTKRSLGVRLLDAIGGALSACVVPPDVQVAYAAHGPYDRAWLMVPTPTYVSPW